VVEIVTVTVNPAIDVSTVVERLVPFYKMRCGKARHDPGGGGINVARVLKRFDMEVRAVFPFGGDTGQLLRRLVKQEGIDSLTVPILGDTREDFSVTEQTSGRQFRFVLPGPTFASEECERLLTAVTDVVPVPDFIIVSGSLPAGVPENFYGEITKIASKAGAKTVIDTSGPALAVALSQGVYLIKPNLREFRELMGAPLENETQWLKAARNLIETSRAQVVALSLGNEGALLVTRDSAWRGYVPKVTPVSTVGAGDSFLGGLIWCLASNRSGEEALRYAIAAGTSALLSPGTDLCHRHDVERLLADVRIEPLVKVR
jgi:6-phosphofructokinase 2